MRLGIIGLGLMGRNFALNFLSRGVPVVGLDPDAQARERFTRETGGLAVSDAASLIAALPAPRAFVLLVPAGAAVDQQLQALLPLMSPQDAIVDCGNSFFLDTERRTAEAAAQGRVFVGMGMSGGEEGARHGPSLMLGGDASVAETLRQLFVPVAASVGGDPCFAHFGPGGAGHFVKMVHNGIEYADMQLIAEAYYLLRNSCGLQPQAIGDIFARWNMGPLASYLLEISAEILCSGDLRTGKPLVDVILDSADQKGTGHWAVSTAMRMGVPAPTIAAAVDARSLSTLVDQRLRMAELRPPATPSGLSPEDVHDALLGGKVVAYVQGFAMLEAAGKDNGFPMAKLAASIWRGGCIIRARLLEVIAEALSSTKPETLMESHLLSELVAGSEVGWRRTIATAFAARIPVPALASALAYWDGLGSARLWADLVQAQRDRFGSHGFQRTDEEGLHHGPWADRR